MPLNIARLSPAEGGGFSAEGLGRARWLVLSNGLDAGGRSATDVAVDVLAVLVLGAGADQMGVLMTLSGLGFLVFGGRTDVPTVFHAPRGRATSRAPAIFCTR